MNSVTSLECTAVCTINGVVIVVNCYYSAGFSTNNKNIVYFANNSITSLSVVFSRLCVSNCCLFVCLFVVCLFVCCLFVCWLFVCLFDCLSMCVLAVVHLVRVDITSVAAVLLFLKLLFFFCVCACICCCCCCCCYCYHCLFLLVVVSLKPFGVLDGRIHSVD